MIKSHFFEPTKHTDIRKYVTVFPNKNPTSSLCVCGGVGFVGVEGGGERGCGGLGRRGGERGGCGERRGNFSLRIETSCLVLEILFYALRLS